MSSAPSQRDCFSTLPNSHTKLPARAHTLELATYLSLYFSERPNRETTSWDMALVGRPNHPHAGKGEAYTWEPGP